MGRLMRLQHMNLTYNYFSGRIPSNLTHCRELTVIEASYNNLIGEIPEQLSSLSKLVVFAFGQNNLTGTIPAWIGNFSSLFAISLALNEFHGNIPDELGKLNNLGFFQLYGNYLSGAIPSSIYNISSIYYFSVTQNQLYGQIPSDVGLTLPNLQIFAGGVNNFTGAIPDSLSNASNLLVLDFAQNSLVGPLPKNLHRLTGLLRLNFDENSLGSGKVDDLSFISYLSNCTSLEVLGLARNHFGGELPSSIANLSTQLQILTLGENRIYGNIPVGIENLVNLSTLGFEGNLLNGKVPDVIGKLKNLEGLHLNYNNFSGSIPSSLGNLTRLTRLFVEENEFHGSIPESLGDCQSLQKLNLSSNNFNGSIPKRVLSLSSLSISLVMSNNLLTGPIPPEVGKLDNLMELDLAENKLSGEIPSSLGGCISLEILSLKGNEFVGTIPESLKTLRALTEIDLSCNNLSGKIPEFLGKLSSIRHLNLSYNDFEGEVFAEGIFANASVVSLVGNDRLCASTPSLLLSLCSKKKQRVRLTFGTIIVVIIAGLLAILGLGVVPLFCMVRNRRKKHSGPPDEQWDAGLTYSELVKSTNGFSDENLIGSGSFGSVYKGTIFNEGKIVAVKVLNLQQHGASKSFIDECNALGSIRHRNLLRIITTCSTIDHQGNDFKALIYEFMQNGNLDEWLHPKENEPNKNKRLRLLTRLNIAIDIASALDYLHHHCEIPIVHCDLKPSNVLLDEDMTAHVGDFGLARFLLDASKTRSRGTQAMSVSLKGSIGYIPPEYGMGGELSTLGDVYSYGILLLEMFTGKRPTDETFKDDQSIHNFVEMALPHHLVDVIDLSILQEGEEGEEEENITNHCWHDIENENLTTKNSSTSQIIASEIETCIITIMSTALSCSSRSPTNRMPINAVVNKLQDCRDSFLRLKQRNKTPS